MCGDFNTEGADLAQAFMYAIDQLSDMDILKGVNVGGLAFDSCSNPTRVTNTLRNFNSGQYKVTQENGMVVDPGSVQFYTAGKVCQILLVFTFLFILKTAFPNSYCKLAMFLESNPKKSSKLYVQQRLYSGTIISRAISPGICLK